MAERDRLRDLQMGEAGHHGVGFGLGAVDQRVLKFAHLLVDAVDCRAQPQPQISRDLVIARTRGVQAAGCRADQLGQTRLDIHVNVFLRLAEGKSAGFYFRLDLV